MDACVDERYVTFEIGELSGTHGLGEPLHPQPHVLKISGVVKRQEYIHFHCIFNEEHNFFACSQELSQSSHELYAES